MFWVWLACAHPSSAPTDAPAARPRVREIQGPWAAGAYATLATEDDTLHVAWLEGEVLRFASSNDRGASWSEPELVAEGVEAGDGGQMIPVLAVSATGPVLAYTHNHRPWLATRAGGAWTTQSLSVAEVGMGALLDLAVLDGNPFVVWLDTRRGPEAYTTDVYAWIDGEEEVVYVDDADGVCMCCRPEAGAFEGRPAVAFRDAAGDLREIRVLVRGAAGWEDRGVATSGGWSPGGCPADGPLLVDGKVVMSDGRDGTRRIYQDDVAVTSTGTSQALQPRAVGGRLFHLEAVPGEVRLVEGVDVLARESKRLEPGDPILVGDEVWLPWQGATAHVLAVR